MPPIQPEAEYEVPWPRRARAIEFDQRSRGRRPDSTRLASNSHVCHAKNPAYERPCPEVHERERHGEPRRARRLRELDEGPILPVVETPLDARLCRRPHHIHRDREDEHAETRREARSEWTEGSRSERQAEARTGDGQGRNEKVCETPLVELVGRFGLLSDEEDLRSPWASIAPRATKIAAAAVDAVRAWSEHTNDDS